MAIKPPPLRAVHFGSLDANDEAVGQPDLLLDGFYDYKEAVFGVSMGAAWFLLGPKGAGKSAVFEHIRLRWQGRHDRFITTWDLRGFPVGDVTNITTGQTAGPSRTQSAWEFLLLLRVMQSLYRDQALEAPGEIFKLKSELSRSGLLPDDWKLSVSRWSGEGATFKLKLPFFGVEVNNRPIGPLEVAGVLRSAIKRTATPNRHLITVDGLDSFFLETADDWTSLAALVHAIESTNRLLAQEGLPVSIVAAIRTEAFESLESTDSNKLKPHCIYLDWSPGGLSADSALWALVDARVRASQSLPFNFSKTYLSGDFGRGPYSSLPEYLLAFTRLLPRDLFALLQHLQDAHPGSSPVSERAGISAVKNYAEQYFVAEVFNNLAGVLPNHSDRQYKTVTFFEAVKSVQFDEFTLKELEDYLEGELSEAETRKLLRQMFDVGAIGIRLRDGRGRVERTDFKYRKAAPVAFNPRRQFLLHNALATAWNKPRY